MRSTLLTLFCFILPFIAIAQSGVITGKVIHADTKTPVESANVFLSNSTAGTSTRADGTFTLSGIKPGQYTLVVSIVGYESFTQSVMVNGTPLNLTIQLQPSNTELHEVVITTPADWRRNYEQFVKDFIGTDDNAKYCTVINPHAVTLQYHRSTQTLEAYTDDFLVVENLALGYRVKFLVKSFNSSKLTNIISYDGQRLFQELKGSKKQVEEWHKKRREAYYGSSMHFYRSLYTDRLDSEGFIMMKYTRFRNPNRPAEQVIQQNIKKYNDGAHRDSVNRWISLENMSKYYRENVDESPIPVNKVLYGTQDPGIFAVNFSGYYLYVVYTKKREQTDFRDIYRPLDMPNYQTSVITLDKPYFFDKNGVVFGQSAPLYEGTWSKSKLSDLLPVDYVPDGPVVPDVDK